MKKFLSVLLCVLLVFLLVSCGEDAFKGTWKGYNESDGSDVVIEFDGAGKIVIFVTDDINSSGTYKDNNDGTITISLEDWDEDVTFVYDKDSLSSGVLMLHDVAQVLPWYQLELQ